MVSGHRAALTLTKPCCLASSFWLETIGAYSYLGWCKLSVTYLWSRGILSLESSLTASSDIGRMRILGHIKLSVWAKGFGGSSFYGVISMMHPLISTVGGQSYPSNLNFCEWYPRSPLLAKLERVLSKLRLSPGHPLSNQTSQAWNCKPLVMYPHYINKCIYTDTHIIMYVCIIHYYVYIYIYIHIHTYTSYIRYTHPRSPLIIYPADHHK